MSGSSGGPQGDERRRGVGGFLCRGSWPGGFRGFGETVLEPDDDCLYNVDSIPSSFSLVFGVVSV